MTEQDLTIQDLRREVAQLKAELEWKDKVIELAQRNEMRWISVEHRQYQTDNLDDAYEQGWEDALDNLKNAPAANVVPVVHGRWEWFDEDTGTPITGYEREWGWRCSCCGYELSDDYDDPDYHPKFNYCPNCGAKMDGGSSK